MLRGGPITLWKILGLLARRMFLGGVAGDLRSGRPWVNSTRGLSAAPPSRCAATSSEATSPSPATPSRIPVDARRPSSPTARPGLRASRSRTSRELSVRYHRPRTADARGGRPRRTARGRLAPVSVSKGSDAPASRARRSAHPRQDAPPASQGRPCRQARRRPDGQRRRRRPGPGRPRPRSQPLPSDCEAVSSNWLGTRPCTCAVQQPGRSNSSPHRAPSPTP